MQARVSHLAITARDYASEIDRVAVSATLLAHLTEQRTHLAREAVSCLLLGYTWGAVADSPSLRQKCFIILGLIGERVARA